MNWFDSVRGRYNIGDRWIGVDYSSNFLDPEQASLTLVHETVHSLLAMQSDFGQATSVIYQLLDDFQHIDKHEQKLIAHHLYFSQDFVQEGFATFMQVAMLRLRVDRYTAQEWVKRNLPLTYQNKLNRLVFALEAGRKYRDCFTEKISHIAMESGFRRDCSKYDLLRSPDKLAAYLSNYNHDPNARLEKIIEAIRYRVWVVTKPPEEIASLSNITFISPSTKQEVAEFLTYVTSLTSRPVTYSQNDIGEAPRGSDAINLAAQNLIVGNMNLNLAETGIPILNPNDFLHHADVIEALFVNLHSREWKKRNLVRFVSGREPDLGIVGFTKTGEKFITTMSISESPLFLNGKLARATMIVKWGAYDPLKDRLIWSSDVRPPDIVLYNAVRDLTSIINKLFSVVPVEDVSYLHVGATEKHPLQTLYCKVRGKHALHCVNTFGNKDIVTLLTNKGDKGKRISSNELQSSKEYLNDTMSVWMGLPWHIDWIETMLDGEHIHFR